MSQRKRIFSLLVLAALLFSGIYTAVSPISPALAGAAAEEMLASAIDWWVVAGGGGKASGGSIVIQDTLGQPVAGESSNGSLVLQAGYWGGAAADYPVFLPLLRR